MFSNEDRVESYKEAQINQSDPANNDDQTEIFGENQGLWLSNGFQRRYACDRCRGHKLRCNRDPMASSSQPCQRCVKAKAECTISSSFRPGKPDNLQKREPSKRSLVTGDESIHSVRKRKSTTTSLDGERRLPYQKDTVMEDYSAHDHTPPPQHISCSQVPRHLPDANNTLLHGHEEQNGDVLQLFSVPWADLMNAGFGDESETSFGAALEQPFPVTASTEVPRYNPRANSKPSSYGGFLEHNRYDLEFLRQGTKGQKPAPQHKFSSSINANQGVKPGEQQYDFSSLESSSPGNFNFLGDVKSTLETISTRTPHHVSERSASPSNMNRKEACIQRLSDLSANLMKDLNRMIACKLACSFLFTPSDKDTAEYLSQTVDGSLCQKQAIGRLFQGTEDFLEILREYEEHSQVTTPIESLFEPSNFSADHSVTPCQRMESRWSVMESYLERSKAPGLTRSRSIASEKSDNSSSQSAAVDIPLMVTILNCYTCLLKIFETILLTFQYILRVPPQSPLYAKLPPVIPDFNINGFPLDNYRRLQFRILIQVSRHMLDLLESTMGFSRATTGTAGILGDPIFQNLFQTLLKRNGLDVPGEDSTGMKKVRDLLTSMEEKLNK